jgi:transcription-repair coupling factor (superfamily II helicase)
VPVTAHLPREYIARDDVRMEAYRRLAAATTADEVADVEREWVDRYGPLPTPARALIDVARVRVACIARGIRELSVQQQRVRIEGWELKKSTEIRLQRLAPSTKVNGSTVVFPIRGVKPGGEAAAVLAVLEEVDPSVASVPS